MLSSVSSDTFSYEFLQSDLPAANLVVLGLTVLERTQRELIKAGFLKSAMQGAQSGVLQIRADVQFSSQQLKEILMLIKNAPDQSYFFHAPDISEPVCVWRARAENRQLLEHQLKEKKCFDVTQLLQNRSLKNASSFLSDQLFAEIYDNTEGWIARGLNKKISFRLTRRLVTIPITPNQITIFNLLLGILGCLGFLSTNYLWQLLGAVLLQLNSVLDGCDGEVARLKVVTSKIGGWLDTIADDILNNVMFLCLILGLFSENKNEVLFHFGLISLMASLGVTTLIYQHLLSQHTHNAAHIKLSWQRQNQSPKGSAGLFDKLKPILKRDFFIFMVFLCVVLKRREMLLIFLVPVWIAFFLYFTSFIHSLFNKNQSSMKR